MKSGGVKPYGSKFFYSKQVGATYSYQSSISGSYDIELWWTQHASRCTNALVQIYNGGSLLEKVIVNQQKNGGRWNYLGPYEFTGRAMVVVLSKDGGCSTIADAIRYLKK